MDSVWLILPFFIVALHVLEMKYNLLLILQEKDRNYTKNIFIRHKTIIKIYNLRLTIFLIDLGISHFDIVWCKCSKSTLIEFR